MTNTTDDTTERLPCHDAAGNYGGYTTSDALATAMDVGTLNAWGWLQDWYHAAFEPDDFNEDGILRIGPGDY